MTTFITWLTRNLYICCGLCLVLTGSGLCLQAQNGKLSGTVMNLKEEPVAGATVKLKDKPAISTTDKKGEFELTGITVNAFLIISAVGYTTLEYRVTDLSEPIILRLLTKQEELDEVTIMSSGYQDIPRERATGSFVQLDNATLNRQVGTNILQRLDGMTNSLLFEKGKMNPNHSQSNLNISIRGLSTISGPLDPLVVLDGFIYEGDINNINPNDVESVTVLRDAAATSIWGARAGNGVIVINTKRGRLNKKLQVSVNTNLTFGNKPDLYYLPQLSSAEYIGVEQYLFNRGYYNATINNTPFAALSPAVELFLRARNGNLSTADSMQAINGLKQTDSRKEYLRHFYTTSVTQQYALNLRGGSERNAYVFSVGYDKAIGENYQANRRLNLKMENRYKPMENLSFTVGAYYTNTQFNSGRLQTNNSITMANQAVPYLSFTDNAGNPLSVAQVWSDRYTDTAGAGKLLDWKYYPLDDYKHNRTVTNLQELFAYTGIDYDLHPFLTLAIKYQHQQQTTRLQRLSTIESFQTRNEINRFSQLNRSTGVVRYFVPLGGIYQTQQAQVQSQTLRGQLDIHPAWGRHEINAILGAEGRKAKSAGDEYTAYGYNTDPLTVTPVDFVNTYPDFVTGSFGQLSGAPAPGRKRENRFLSLYANLSYSFQRKYILSGSMRKDGSNLFGVNTNDRWNPLWSVGGSWKLSREKFYKMTFLPTLQIRASYGVSGNLDLTKTAMAVASYAQASPTTNLPFGRINTVNNPSLRWEKSAMLNLAVDYAFRNNRINGAIEYYRKKGTDLYGLAPYDYTAYGLVPSITRNVAHMRGHGLDMTLHSLNIDRTFKWNSSFLFSFNVAKTTRYFTEEALNLHAFLGSGTSITPIVGKPLYAIAAYKWGGLDNQGNPQGFLKGERSTDYQAILLSLQTPEGRDGIRYMGPANPPVFGSLFNTFQYKQFSLSFNIQYKLGYYFRRSSVSSYSGVLQAPGGHSDYTRRWQQPGDENRTTVPAFIYPENTMRDAFYGFAEIHILKADHLRLQFVQLDYTWKPRRWNQQQVQLYLNMANLGIIWRKNNAGLDPDYPNTIPPALNTTIGLRLQL